MIFPSYRKLCESLRSVRANASLVGAVPLVACDPMPGSAPPFTDWQNDLRLISGFVYR